ncbi:hypothetical protein [Streptomyces sp. NPDC048565]|uniref:hypothetical protein n=1 Tax=Streptomyces sp. NPDC048565 TaxID=3155266 RepID=UPI0034270588
MVRYYVASRKPEILVESGKAPLEAFVPQTHLPGHEAEVDFGDVAVRLAGELVTYSCSSPDHVRALWDNGYFGPDPPGHGSSWAVAR